MSAPTLYYTAVIGPGVASMPELVARHTELLLKNIYRLAEEQGVDIIEDSIKPTSMAWGEGTRLLITADTKERA